jgi:hypothetical protein
VYLQEVDLYSYGSFCWNSWQTNRRNAIDSGSSEEQLHQDVCVWILHTESNNISEKNTLKYLSHFLTFISNCVNQQSTALGPSFVLSFINNAVVRMTIMYYFFKMILKQKTLNTMQYLQLRFKVMLMRNKGQEMGQIF